MATKYIHFTEQQKEQARQTDIAEMLRSQGETLRREARPGGKGQPHPVGLVLHDGVDGQGSPQGHPADAFEHAVPYRRLLPQPPQHLGYG